MTRAEFEIMKAKRAAERKRRQAMYRRRRIFALVALVLAIIILVVLVRGCTNAITNAIKADEESQSTSIFESSDQTTKNDKTDEKATPEPTKEPEWYDPKVENDLIKIIEAIELKHPEKKVCYLTFDDGPSKKVTPQVLDTLDEYGINATFFVTGAMINEYPDIAQDAYKRGNLLANHSVNHNYSQLYASSDDAINEFEKCEAKILSIVGKDKKDSYFKLIRFPGGVFNTTADPYTPVKLNTAKKLADKDYFYANWNALTGDAEGAPKDADGLLEYLKLNLSDNETQVIVLMHDTDAKQNTADALASVIEYFRDRDFEFGTLDVIPYYDDVAEYLKNQKNKPTTDVDEEEYYESDDGDDYE